MNRHIGEHRGAFFVIFGAVLNAGEAGQGFMNLASAAAGQ